MFKRTDFPILPVYQIRKLQVILEFFFSSIMSSNILEIQFFNFFKLCTSVSFLSPVLRLLSFIWIIATDSYFNLTLFSYVSCISVWIILKHELGHIICLTYFSGFLLHVKNRNQAPMGFLRPCIIWLLPFSISSCATLHLSFYINHSNLF